MSSVISNAKAAEQDIFTENTPMYTYQRHPKLEYKDDTYSFTTGKTEDKSNNGKFDVSECAKNFVKGVISPVTAIIEHPVMTIGAVAVTAAIGTLIPAIMPAVGIGFGALSAFQLGKGIYSAAKNYKNGEYDKAEQSFNAIGQGTVGVATSALGLKQGAKVAKETKLMNELGVTSLDKAQKAAISDEISNGSYVNALKETVSLYTTRSGLKAVAAQFRPSNIAQRGKDAVNFLFKKEEVTKIKKEKAKFKDTPEGQRRANLSSEEIEAEVKALYKEACDEYGIPEELRAEVKVTKSAHSDANGGGSYNPSAHTLEINETAYREGTFDLPDTIKHETTHEYQAIQRQRLPMEEKEQLAKQYLLDKIMNGDKENVTTGKQLPIVGNETVKPPKMNTQMKKDFANLAENKLYQTAVKYSDDELAALVRPLAESNPEFVSSYDNMDDAVNALSNYAKSHQSRYQNAIKNAAGFNTENIDTSLLKELTPQEKQAVAKDFLDGIDALESNAANRKLFGGDFDQYQFTPEEVLAQQRGGEFEISKLEAQLAKLRSSENYDLSEEARLLDQIKKYRLNIEYKTKGQEMYRLYTESINHPENQELAKQVSSMKAELKGIQNSMKEIDCSYCDFLNFFEYVESNNYVPYTTTVRPEMGASVYIPASTTVAADIIADDLSKADNE